MYGAFEPNNPYTYSFVQEVDLVILPFTISLTRSRVMKHVGFIGGDNDALLSQNALLSQKSIVVKSFDKVSGTSDYLEAVYSPSESKFAAQ